MDGFRGSSSRSSSSAGSEPDVSSSSGWQEEEEALGGGAVPSSTSDAKTTHSAVQGKCLFTYRRAILFAHSAAIFATLSRSFIKIGCGYRLMQFISRFSFDDLRNEDPGKM